MIEGQLLGSYRLLDRIGRGGMGVVWRARDERSGTFVALKEVAPEHARDPLLRERRLREAEALLAFSHPNVVRLLDVARDGSFLVFELLEGGSLEERLAREGRLRWREAARLGAQVARALAAAHARGIVHRDVKPGNVLLDGEGPARLADFGLARVADARSLTETGELLGTVGFAAPEQVEGEKGAGPRADLYALGALLHALVAGEPPFGHGTAVSIMKRQATERPRPLRALEKETPPALERLVLSLLERRPEDRPGSASAVLSVLEGLEEEAPRAGRRKVLLALPLLFLLGVALALLVLGGSKPAPPVLPGTPPGPPPSSRPAAPPSEEKAASREILSVAAVELPGETPVVAAGDDEGFLGFWSLVDGSFRARFATHVGAVEALSFHPRAPLLVARTREGGVALVAMPFESSTRIPTLQTPGELRAAIVDPTGRILTAFADGSVEVVSTSDATRNRHLAPGGAERFTCAALGFVDPGVLAVFGRETGAIAFHLADGPKHSESALPGDGEPIVAIALPLEPGRVAVGGARGLVRLISVDESGLRILESQRDSSGVSSLAISGDGEMILSGHEDGTIHRLAAGSSRLLARLPRRVSALAFTADGSRVVAASGGKLALIDANDGKRTW